MVKEEFNAGDPFDATAERIRMMMCEFADCAIETPEYRLLSPHQKVEAVLCGMMTGVMCVAFAFIKPEGRDDIVAFIKSYVDQAREQAEEIYFSEGLLQ